jgi:hypothetical protein
VALIIRNDLLYLHIPKTGGNWLTSVLERQGLVLSSIGHKHATYDLVCGLLQSHNGKSLASKYLSANPTVFCVVRHPIKWYESWFRYQYSREWRDWGKQGDFYKWHVMSDLNSSTSDDFNQFIYNVNSKTPGYVSQLFAKYVNNSSARALKNENLNEEFAEFLEQLGIGGNYDAVRKSPRIGESPRIDLEWDSALLKQTYG